MIFSSIVLLPAFACATSAVTTPIANNHASTNGQDSYFFIQNADNVVLEPGKVILKHIEPQTLWFADAPSRDTGHISASEYMHLWDTPTAQFTALHPNAVLQGYLPKEGNKKAQRLSAVFILTAANYNPITKTLTYHVEKSYLMPDKQAISQTVNLQHSSLLIDTASLAVGAGF